MNIHIKELFYYSTFLYYFGLNHADLCAVIDADTGERVVYGDELTVEHIVWMGSQPSLKSRCLETGIEKIPTSQRITFSIGQEYEYLFDIVIDKPFCQIQIRVDNELLHSWQGYLHRL